MTSQRLAAAGALVLCGCVLWGCGRGDDREAVRAVAVGFYAAVEDRDGARACALLSDDARQAVEDQEAKSCPEAVEDLELTSGAPGEVRVFSRQAAVELVGGDTVFLGHTDRGWRVSAVGCRPAPVKHEPAQCEVEA